MKNRTFSRDPFAQIEFVVLLRGRSSDSDGDYTKYVASVNDRWLVHATFSTVEIQSVLFCPESHALNARFLPSDKTPVDLVNCRVRYKVQCERTQKGQLPASYKACIEHRIYPRASIFQSVTNGGKTIASMSSPHIYLHLLNFCTAKQTDVWLARYRDDAESDDDKLESCLSLKCHKIRARRPTTKTAATAGASTSGRAKRARPPSDEAEDYDEDGSSEDTGDTSGVEVARGVDALGPKSKGKAKAKARASSKIDWMAERPVWL